MARLFHLRDVAIVLCTICATFITHILFTFHAPTLDTRVIELERQILRYQQILKSLNKHTRMNFEEEFNTKRIPRSRMLDRKYQPDLAVFQSRVTLLIFTIQDKRGGCLPYQISSIRKILPEIKIIITSMDGVHFQRDDKMVVLNFTKSTTEGKALNEMLKMVDTEFFLYLSEGSTISDFQSDNSPAWLLHSLLSIPELDFVGGGYVKYNATLRYPKYEAQCYRLRMCRWIFSQSYEYKYSIGDMMVCEETSTSFMGRTASVSAVGKFDESLTALTTTDFFWRARLVANVGLRPEVYFHVSKKCTVVNPIAKVEKLQQLFMYKYDLRQVKDSYGRITRYRNNSVQTQTQPIWSNFSRIKDGGMLTPTTYTGLLNVLYMLDDFFKMHPEITHHVSDGVALGAIKMRGILPWDTRADVDVWYYGFNWTDLRKKLVRHCRHCQVSTGRINNMDKAKPGRVFMRIRCPNAEGAYYELITYEPDPTPTREDMMYVLINGRDIPAKRDLFKIQRETYGINYLQHRAGKNDMLKCHKPGHHACVPAAFANGSGHWKEIYCDY